MSKESIAKNGVTDFILHFPSETIKNNFHQVINFKKLKKTEKTDPVFSCLTNEIFSFWEEIYEEMVRKYPHATEKDLKRFLKNVSILSCKVFIYLLNRKDEERFYPHYPDALVNMDNLPEVKRLYFSTVKSIIKNIEIGKKPISMKKLFFAKPSSSQIIYKKIKYETKWEDIQNVAKLAVNIEETLFSFLPLKDESKTLSEVFEKRKFNSIKVRLIKPYLDIKIQTLISEFEKISS